jgi:CRP/FNR family cyclic AMP-dependent transcriptional regulator
MSQGDDNSVQQHEKLSVSSSTRYAGHEFCLLKLSLHHRSLFMLSPYGLEITESCLTCNLWEGRMICDLDHTDLQAFERIKYTTAYPKGAVLFLEVQAPRGIFVVCKGQVKLSLGDRNGKTFILKIVDPGEVLGLGAAFSGKSY